MKMQIISIKPRPGPICFCPKRITHQQTHAGFIRKLVQCQRILPLDFLHLELQKAKLPIRAR